MLHFIKLTITKVLVTSIVLFYGTLVSLNLLVKWVHKGNSFWITQHRKSMPDILNRPVYGKHSFAQLKNLKLHYVEKGDRKNPLIIFLHGFPEFWFTWRNQINYFARTHWVVAVDMRGYNQSSKPVEIKEYAMELLIRDVNELVHSLGKESCVLVGHDWGGAVGWQVAGWTPGIVDKLVILNSPHPTAYGDMLRSSLKQFLKAWYVFFFQLPWLPELAYKVDDLAVLSRLFGPNTTSEELEAYKWVWSQKNALTPPINYYRNLLEPKNLVTPKVLPQIKVPTLIVWGENDLALEKELAVMCDKYVEKLQVVFIPGASHFVHHDKPDIVNRAISDFLV